MCPSPTSSYASSVTTNCATTGLIFSDYRVGLDSGDLHQTNVFLANGSLALVVSDGIFSNKCGATGYTEEAAHAHDTQVRDYLDDLVGPPPDPCVTANGGCAQVCTNNRGSAVCSCNTGNTMIAGVCKPGLVLQSKFDDYCIFENGGGFGQTTGCDPSRYSSMALFEYTTEGAFTSIGLCLTAKNSLTQTVASMAACASPLADNQKWQCNKDQTIQLVNTEIFLQKGGLRQCNQTHSPDTCVLAELQFKAFGEPTCPFCEVAMGTCGGGGKNLGPDTSGAASWSSSSLSLVALLALRALL